MPLPAAEMQASAVATQPKDPEESVEGHDVACSLSVTALTELRPQYNDLSSAKPKGCELKSGQGYGGSIFGPRISDSSLMSRKPAALITGSIPAQYAAHSGAELARYRPDPVADTTKDMVGHSQSGTASATRPITQPSTKAREQAGGVAKRDVISIPDSDSDEEQDISASLNRSSKGDFVQAEQATRHTKVATLGKERTPSLTERPPLKSIFTSLKEKKSVNDLVLAREQQAKSGSVALAPTSSPAPERPQLRLQQQEIKSAAPGDELALTAETSKYSTKSNGIVTTGENQVLSVPSAATGPVLGAKASNTQSASNNQPAILKTSSADRPSHSKESERKTTSGGKDPIRPLNSTNRHDTQSSQRPASKPGSVSQNRANVQGNSSGSGSANHITSDVAPHLATIGASTPKNGILSASQGSKTDKDTVKLGRASVDTGRAGDSSPAVKMLNGTQVGLKRRPSDLDISARQHLQKKARGSRLGQTTDLLRQAGSVLNRDAEINDFIQSSSKINQRLAKDNGDKADESVAAVHSAQSFEQNRQDTRNKQAQGDRDRRAEMKEVELNRKSTMPTPAGAKALGHIKDIKAAQDPKPHDSQAGGPSGDAGLSKRGMPRSQLDPVEQFKQFDKKYKANEPKKTQIISRPLDPVSRVPPRGAGYSSAATASATSVSAAAAATAAATNRKFQPDMQKALPTRGKRPPPVSDLKRDAPPSVAQKPQVSAPDTAPAAPKTTVQRKTLAPKDAFAPGQRVIQYLVWRSREYNSSLGDTWSSRPSEIISRCHSKELANQHAEKAQKSAEARKKVPGTNTRDEIEQSTQDYARDGMVWAWSKFKSGTEQLYYVERVEELIGAKDWGNKRIDAEALAVIRNRYDVWVVKVLSNTEPLPTKKQAVDIECGDAAQEGKQQTLRAGEAGKDEDDINRPEAAARDADAADQASREDTPQTVVFPHGNLSVFSTVSWEPELQGSYTEVEMANKVALDTFLAESAPKNKRIEDVLYYEKKLKPHFIQEYEEYLGEGEEVLPLDLELTPEIGRFHFNFLHLKVFVTKTVLKGPIEVGDMVVDEAPADRVGGAARK